LSYFEPLSRTASLSSNAFVQDAFIRTTDCYFMEKNYSKAKTGYDKVVQYSWPAEDYATFQLAMLAGVNSANQKISLLKTMIRKFPNSTLLTDANMEVAKAYMSNEKFSEAIPYLSDIIKTSGNKNMVPEAYLKLGTAYFNLNSNSEALNEFKELVDKYP
ncbi:MAG: tetratricopeptide repeat protein, partial [Chitinophagaceae bacterium]|nr:tetratricopeptide repeat protein [Chitinophagaceae bacterium]